MTLVFSKRLFVNISAFFSFLKAIAAGSSVKINLSFEFQLYRKSELIILKIAYFLPYTVVGRGTSIGI